MPFCTLQIIVIVLFLFFSWQCRYHTVNLNCSFFLFNLRQEVLRSVVFVCLFVCSLICCSLVCSHPATSWTGCRRPGGSWVSGCVRLAQVGDLRALLLVNRVNYGNRQIIIIIIIIIIIVIFSASGKIYLNLVWSQYNLIIWVGLGVNFLPDKYNRIHDRTNSNRQPSDPVYTGPELDRFPSVQPHSVLKIINSIKPKNICRWFYTYLLN